VKRALRVGVVLPTRETVIYGKLDPTPLLDMAEQAEHQGFDSVWVGDSIFVSGRFEPLVLLSAIAARTRTVTLGTAILVAPLRHPVLLAHAVTSLDRISGGRVVLGVGAGWLQQEFDAVGVPYAERTGRLAETIRCCRALWSGEGSFHGKYWSFDGVNLQPLPQQEGGPPILVGGAGPRALRIAADFGDGWFPTSPDPAAFASGLAEVNPATAAVYLTINLDPERGPHEVRDYAQMYYGMPLDVMQQFQGYFVGPPDECLAWIRGYVDAGADHVVLRFATPDAADQMSLAAEELLPELRGIEVEQ